MSMWPFIVAGLLLVSARLVLAYRRAKRTALARYRASSTVIDTRVGPVEYRVEGDGPTILYLHGGAGGAAEQTTMILDMLVPQAYRVVGISRPGHRRTPLSSGRGFEGQADAAAAVLDELGIDTVAAVLGLSAGGPSAMQFTMRHAERCTKLVLMSAHGPGTVSFLPSPFMINLLYVLTKADFITWLNTRLPVQGLMVMQGDSAKRLTPQALRIARYVMDGSFPSSDLNEGMFADIESLLNSGDWPISEITTPTLILHGAKDIIVRPAVATYHAEQIPNSTLIMYPDGAHFAFATHWQEMGEAINAFLESG